MKKIFTIILTCMALALPMIAQESNGKSTSRPITLETHTKDDQPHNPIHRAPMRICVEAWYDAASSILSIIYDGEAEGEVALYRDGQLINVSSEINTTFMIPGSGFYSVEINTEVWTATGEFEIYK